MNPWPTLAGVAVGFGSLLAAGPASLAASTVLPYREILGHVVVVPVYLDGRGPYDLVLDTAATSTILAPDLAAELGIEPLASVPIVTLAGARAARWARLDRIALGPVEVSGVEVLCAEIAVLRSADPRVRGILGQSTLARMSFGLDHARQQVMFDAPRRPDAVLPLDEREGRPAVRLQPRRSREALSLVLDSGLSVPVLFEKHGTPLPMNRVAGGFFQTETIAGAARLPMAHLEGELGVLRLDATPAAVQDDAAAGGREEDGLLPTRLFRIVYFDRGEKQLLLLGR